MSFIVHRDVFGLSDEEVDKLGEFYDKLEEEYYRDYVKDEYGETYPFEDVPSDKLPFSIGGWDMLLYINDRMKKYEDIWKAILSESESNS